MPNVKFKRQTIRRVAGFTLIELMIAVAIVGILAAVAIPQYKDYVLRGAVVDGQTLLASMQSDMERYYQDNRSYAAINGFTPPCSSAASTSKFSFSCSNLSTTTYTLQATGVSGTNVSGLIYTVNAQNVRATTGVPTNSGWSTCTSRWIGRKGDVCS